MSGPRRRKFVGPLGSRVTWHAGRGRQRNRWALIIALAKPVGIDEGEELANRFLQDITRDATNATRLPHAPVQALYLVGKDRPLNAKPLGQKHLEWIPLYL